MAEQIQKVHSRKTPGGATGMWGTLHVNQRHELVGWLVDTWTEAGVEPHLRPKLHWVPRADEKFYHVQLNIDFRSSMVVFEEDTEIEPNRAPFIKKTLALWEREWIEGEARKF